MISSKSYEILEKLDKGKSSEFPDNNANNGQSKNKKENLNGTSKIPRVNGIGLNNTGQQSSSAINYLNDNKKLEIENNKQKSHNNKYSYSYINGASGFQTSGQHYLPGQAQQQQIQQQQQKIIQKQEHIQEQQYQQIIDGNLGNGHGHSQKHTNGLHMTNRDTYEQQQQPLGQEQKYQYQAEFQNVLDSKKYLNVMNSQINNYDQSQNTKDSKQHKYFEDIQKGCLDTTTKKNKSFINSNLFFVKSPKNLGKENFAEYQHRLQSPGFSNLRRGEKHIDLSPNRLLSTNKNVVNKGIAGEEDYEILEDNLQKAENVENCLKNEELEDESEVAGGNKNKKSNYYYNLDSKKRNSKNDYRKVFGSNNIKASTGQTPTARATTTNTGNGVSSVVFNHAQKTNLKNSKSNNENFGSANNIGMSATTTNLIQNQNNSYLANSQIADRHDRNLKQEKTSKNLNTSYTSRPIEYHNTNSRNNLKNVNTLTNKEMASNQNMQNFYGDIFSTRSPRNYKDYNNHHKNGGVNSNTTHLNFANLVDKSPKRLINHLQDFNDTKRYSKNSTKADSRQQQKGQETNKEKQNNLFHTEAHLSKAKFSNRYNIPENSTSAHENSFGGIGLAGGQTPGHANHQHSPTLQNTSNKNINDNIPMTNHKVDTQISIFNTNTNTNSNNVLTNKQTNCKRRGNYNNDNSFMEASNLAEKSDYSLYAHYFNSLINNQKHNNPAFSKISKNIVVDNGGGSALKNLSKTWVKSQLLESKEDVSTNIKLNDDNEKQYSKISNCKTAKDFQAANDHKQLAIQNGNGGTVQQIRSSSGNNNQNINQIALAGRKKDINQELDNMFVEKKKSGSKDSTTSQSNDYQLEKCIGNFFC